MCTSIKSNAIDKTCKPNLAKCICLGPTNSFKMITSIQLADKWLGNRLKKHSALSAAGNIIFWGSRDALTVWFLLEKRYVYPLKSLMDAQLSDNWFWKRIFLCSFPRCKESRWYHTSIFWSRGIESPAGENFALGSSHRSRYGRLVLTYVSTNQ